MQFDDRLETVLRLPPMGEAFARIQYRQLIDILGSIPGEARSPQIDRAYQRLEELSAAIPHIARAQMLRPSLSRLRSRRLLAMLAESEPSVASAAIGSAQMSEDDWLALIPALTVRARGILRHRRGLGSRVERLLAQLGVLDRGLPPADFSADEFEEEEVPLELTDVAEQEIGPDTAVEHAADQVAGAETSEVSEPASEIARLLRRIEEFNRSRRARAEPIESRSDAPRLPLDDADMETSTARTAPFDFTTDTEGRISWADSQVAPMVVGMPLAEADGSGTLLAPTDRMVAMRQRQPIRNLPVSLATAPAVSGDWRMDAAPRFDRDTGGFRGYCGRFRRPAAASGNGADMPSPESDRIRQVLHELRNPANAIQVSAEMIQQDVLGSASHGYRAIAALIASDIAYVLAGFEELERLARLESKAIAPAEGTGDLAAVTESVVEQLQDFTETRESGFAFTPPDRPIHTCIAEAELEPLVWRLLAFVAGETAPSERLALSCRMEDDDAVLAIELPAALAALGEDALFRGDTGGASSGRALSAGPFGAGFSLRLSHAEAEAAGGALKRDGNELRLTLPTPTAERKPQDQV